MMKNGKPSHVRWCVKFSIITLVQLSCPMMSSWRCKPNVTDVELANNSIGLAEPSLIEVQLNEVKLFDSISPSQMAESQKRDTQLSLVYEYVASGHKPRLTEIHRVSGLSPFGIYYYSLTIYL